MENGDSFYMCQMNGHARTDANHAFDHMPWAAGWYNTGKYRCEKTERFPLGEMRECEWFKHQLQLHLQHKQLKLSNLFSALKRNSSSFTGCLRVLSCIRPSLNHTGFLTLKLFGFFFSFFFYSCKTEVEEQCETRRNVFATVSRCLLPFQKCMGLSVRGARSLSRVVLPTSGQLQTQKPEVARTRTKLGLFCRAQLSAW